MQYNFLIAPTDTDSISYCKSDLSPFTKEERISLLKELNDLSPDMMIWEDDGYYKTIIAVRAKNYVLQKEDGSIVYKGSGVKAPNKEIALREFINKIIGAMLEGKENYTEIYNKYVKEALSIKDISRWTSKKTITPSVLNPKRANEQKVLNCISGTEYVEGDKIRVFFKSDETLSLQEKFDGDYHLDKMLEKLYKTSNLFKFILNTEELFLNYKLKKNKKLLEEFK